MTVILVMVCQFLFEQLIGLIVVRYLFVSKEGYESFLKSAKEPLDLAFGVGDGATR